MALMVMDEGRLGRKVKEEEGRRDEQSGSKRIFEEREVEEVESR